MTGPFSGELNLIQTLLNKFMKSFLGAKQDKYIILRWNLIIPVFLSLHYKRRGCYTWIQVNIWWTSKNGIFENKQSSWTSELITIYKAFVRPYLDYGDILYDRA